MSSPEICLIGDIVIDVTRRTAEAETKMRLGGIVHAARGLWALDVPFAVGYVAPDYLDGQIHRYLTSLGCQHIEKMGTVLGAPGVFLIEEAKEIGDQGYEFLLRDELQIVPDQAALDSLSQKAYTDYLVISGNYDLQRVVNSLKGSIHLDLTNNITELSVLEEFHNKLETLFLSTSSPLFSSGYSNDFREYTSQFEPYTQRIILKENRGGSRAFDFTTATKVDIPAQPRQITHSVGVGDVYDVAFVSRYRQEENVRYPLVLASWVAAEYACTSFPDDLKKAVQRVTRSPISDLALMPGVLLPWEDRKKVHIYLAAPDFSYVDTTLLDTLENSLIYHNFTPRRPVRENGQMEENASRERRRELFTKDMEVFAQCRLLVAVLLYADPGTLIEIGLAAAKGMPVIVYDPFHIATNCMLTELPTLVTTDLDEVISEVFIQSSKLQNHA